MENIWIPLSDLNDCCRKALERVGVPEEHIRLTLQVLVTADLQGISTHGTRRLIPYIMRIRSGLIKARPKIEVHAPTAALRIVEGDGGLGPAVGMTGLNEAVKAARETGVAFAGCRNSNHFGPGAPYAWAACEEGMICIGGTNAFPTMTPWGGKEVIVGNNPLFVGVPRRGGTHFLLDFAMSGVAKSKLRTAAERGEAIPLGWALDGQGNPTTDPREGLKGHVLPMGGHKGYGLALAIDIIAGVLTGSGYGIGVLSLFQQWKEPQRVGHFFICLNPDSFMGPDVFHDRLESLFRTLKTSTPIDARSPVLLPGEIEKAKMNERREKGIPFDPPIWSSLASLAEGKYDEVKVSDF
jgi:ureidoglycolate dehydrogenase (NAD+)